MATRLLRQYYEPVRTTIPDAVAGLEPWRRHRARFTDALRALPDDDWQAPTRCTEWRVREVVGHMVTVDAYWVFALGAARSEQPPARFLEHFDPSRGTDAQVAALQDVAPAELFDRFATGALAFATLVESFTSEDWTRLGESPLGHLPARVLFGHAFWDSWLHERDIFVPLGRAPRAEPDELLTVTTFCLLFAGLEGGLLGDPAATGPALREPVDVRVRFDELPDTALRIVYDTGAHVELADPADATAVGSAVTLVEAFTGRRPLAELDARLPDDVAAHLGRAAQVL
jgi:uncharacterized protein (TIGR03083 family)